MQDVKSNIVYVVSLGDNAPDGGSLSWIEIVRDRRRYFHHVGGTWPKEPPNYLAFRYAGRLQSIHHVESYVISTDAGDLPGLPPSWDWSVPRVGRGTGPHFLYTLGPAIFPPQIVRSGPRVKRVFQYR